MAVLCAAVATMCGATAQSALATGQPVAGWGANERGQLGNGGTTNSNVPVQSGEFGGEVVALATSGGHTLALMANGTVKAVGLNATGQLGNGTTTSSTTPVEVKELKEVVAVSATGNYSMALLANGHVMAWGENIHGVLGNGTTANSSVPVEVKEISEAVGIATASDHALAVLSNGTVEDWGINRNGDLGNGSYTESSTVPVAVSGISEAVEVAGGNGFSVARLASGKVVAWGENGRGQLGTGNRAGPSTCTRSVGFVEPTIEEFGCTDTPATVSGVTTATKISAGDQFTLALLSGGTAVSWGSNELGELGTGSLSGPNSCPVDFEVEFGIVIALSTPCSEAPVAVTSLSGVVAISSGWAHSQAVLSGGAVKAWGSNIDGSLGTGTSAGQSPTPTSVTGVGEVVGLATGGDASLSIGPLLPTVTSISTKNGPGVGGTTVKITGTHLTGVSSVKFGNAAASGVTEESSTSLTAVSPAHKLGVVDVTVVTGHGTTATSSADRFTYVPEVLGFGRCTNVGAGAGNYKNPSCGEVLEKGKYEWTPGVSKAGITIADGIETVEKVEKPRKVLFETTAKAQLSCTDVSGSAEFLGTSAVVSDVMSFTGCELSASKCSSLGAGTGVIVTNSLTGTLGWREKAGNLVGLALAAAEEGVWFEATCGSTTVKVTGSAIGAMTPVNNMNPTLTLKLKQSKGKQSVEHFEEEAVQELRMSLNGGLPVQTGLALETIQSTEEQIEINTVV